LNELIILIVLPIAFATYSSCISNYISCAEHGKVLDEFFLSTAGRIETLAINEMLLNFI